MHAKTKVKSVSAQRAISSKFMCDLMDGFLLPLTEQVRNDDTLMLALRGSYINIYYRGGSILKF